MTSVDDRLDPTVVKFGAVMACRFKERPGRFVADLTRVDPRHQQARLALIESDGQAGQKLKATMLIDQSIDAGENLSVNLCAINLVGGEQDIQLKARVDLKLRLLPQVTASLAEPHHCELG